MFGLLTRRTQAPTTPRAFITLEKVHKTYPNGAIGLKGIDLTLDQGNFLWVSGASGSGKSTLLKMLYGAERPDQGQVWVEGQAVAHLRSGALAGLRRKIGVVFQDYKLLPKRTVAENVTFVLRALGHDRAEIRRRLWPTLKMVDLESKADCYPDQLSGGEQQRVAIARAMVHTPLLFLADEPTGNLDPENTQMIIAILEQLNQMGVTVIVSTHDQSLLDCTTHPVLALAQGGINTHPLRS